MFAAAAGSPGAQVKGRRNGEAANRAERHRSAVKTRQRAATAALNELGPLPPVAHPRRRAACKRDPLRFLKSYLGDACEWDFSEAHKRSIERMRRAALEGGQVLEIVFRGFGKTTIFEGIVLWCGLYGHRRFIVPVSANSTAAGQSVESLARHLETNERLLEDFPEVCIPIRKVAGAPQRCRQQTYNGTRTGIQWTSDKIIFPTIPGSAASGVIITPRGVTSHIRGLVHTNRAGERVRPDFLFIDDLQTDESAASPMQCAKRLRILNKTLLRLGGHKKKIAACIAATIIEPDDLIDQLATEKKHRAWQTERVKMLVSFASEPAHTDLWLTKYADLRANYDPENPADQKRAHEAATDFYAKHREAMDAGAVATWSECYDRENEISAVQHAYNILIDTGPEAFASECQNEPLKAETVLELPGVDELANKFSGYARGIVPSKCTTITTFFDVHPTVLYWGIVAWAPDFTGYVIDYGTWPDQRRRHFRHSAAPKTLAKHYGMTEDAALYHGLTDLMAAIAGREFHKSDGSILRLRQGLIDANGEARETVFEAIRASPHAPLFLPSFGVGVTAKKRRISEWSNVKVIRGAQEMAYTKPKNKKELPGLAFDSNYHKTRTAKALALPVGAATALSIFTPAKGEAHRMLAEHWTAELPDEVTANGRTVIEWSLKPARDNHQGDVLVGNRVAASLCGITTTPAATTTRRRPRRRIRT